MATDADRRRIARIQLDTPINAKVSTSRVNLVDISAEGARIEHPFPLSRGKEVILNFEHEGQIVTIHCRVVRCKFEKHDERVSYYSGLRFAESDEMVGTLREIIASTISRDFDARRAMLKIKD